MPEERHLPPGHVITYPNREKPASQLTKLIVVIVMLASVVLMLAVTIGGWNKLQGLVPVNFAWCVVYLAIAFLVMRWARGLLPIVAGLAILLLIISLIAGLGGSGTSWFDRNHADYAATQSMFGGSGLSPDTLGVLTLLVAPVQAILIIVSMVAFTQGWNVEVERHIDDIKGRKPPRTPGVTTGDAEPQLG